MTKKEENTVKTKAKKENNSKTEAKSNTIIKETITYDNTPIFNKILVCLYVIIALLALNIIITAVKSSNNETSSNGTNNNSKTTTPTTETVATYDVSKFKKINTDEFIEAYNGSEMQLIFLGSPQCGHCIRFAPVLTEVQEKYNFKALYLDVSATSDADRIIALNEEFFTGKDTKYGYTPSTLIVKDGKIVDYQIGSSDASTLEALVSKYFDKK